MCGMLNAKSSVHDFTGLSSGRTSQARSGVWSPLVPPSTPQWIPPRQVLIITTKG
jgi:hypothetical protein